MDNHGCTFAEGGDRAFFRPSEKLVQMPLYNDFDTPFEWVGVFAHEVGHSTKLNTNIKGNEERGGLSFGDKKYALEELVAEFFSVLYCNYFGIEQTELNNIAYFQSWLGALKLELTERKKSFYDAVNIASKNFEYCLEVLGEK